MLRSVGERRKPPGLIVLGWVLVAWALYALLLLLQILPDTPSTPRAWALLLVIGPPTYFVLEWTSGRLLGAEAGARISPARFSLARVALALLVAVIALAPFAWWFLRNAA